MFDRDQMIGLMFFVFVLQLIMSFSSSSLFLSLSHCYRFFHQIALFYYHILIVNGIDIIYIFIAQNQNNIKLTGMSKKYEAFHIESDDKNKEGRSM